MHSAVIIGMPLSGKSTLLRAFASAVKAPHSRLGEVRCVMLDEEIERRTGMRIPEIFEKRGEGYFREMEAEVLGELATRDGVVVEAGGGAVCAEASRAAISKFGAVVYIKCGLDTLLERASASEVVSRPLLSASGDPAAKIAELYGLRCGHYEALATHVICADAVEKSTEKLIKILSQNILL